MPDLPVLPHERFIAEAAWMRVASSENADHFLRSMRSALSAVARGADPATAAWNADDPIRLAAEIEVLAGLRRLASLRKDTK